MQKLRIAFVVEQVLGHRTHYQNLQRFVAQDSQIEPVWIPIKPYDNDFWQRLPGVKNNWTLLSSLRARSALKAAIRVAPLDVIYFHTQVMMLASIPLMKQIPTVASLDATPIGMDSLDEGYGERHRNAWIERKKNAVNSRVLSHCHRLFAWNQWAAQSLADNYDVDPERISVLAPGIDLTAWHFTPTDAASASERVRLLFVGGDFHRKGGDLLLDLFRGCLADRCELDIVTGPELTGAEDIAGVRVHRGLNPNSTGLLDLYRRADLFVLPTRGDCMPWAILEAAAAGLPVVVTGHAAIPEMVQDGVTGFVVPPHDVQLLKQRVLELVDSPALRRQMGKAAHAAVARRYDGDRNYGMILEQLKLCAGFRGRLPKREKPVSDVEVSAI